MKLVYANGACSLGVHIMLDKLGKGYQAIRVDLEDKRVLESYNSLGYVPALVLDSGVVMLEAVSILQYLAFQNDMAFLPKDKFSQAKCLEWLSFLSSELHKVAGPLFNIIDLKEDFIKTTYAKLEKRLQVMDDRLQENTFLMGDQETIADFYALGILRILQHVRVPLDHFTAIKKFKKGLEEDPVILAILKLEQSAQIETKVWDSISSKEKPYAGDGFSANV